MHYILPSHRKGQFRGNGLLPYSFKILHVESNACRDAFKEDSFLIRKATESLGWPGLPAFVILLLFHRTMSSLRQTLS